jgi:hypothetical protein
VAVDAFRRSSTQMIVAFDAGRDHDATPVSITDAYVPDHYVG